MTPYRLFVAILLCTAAATGAGAATVPVVPVEGPIGPAVADFATRSIARAAEEGASMVILRLDTPGGLDSSMREICQAILASPIPVVGFVAPGGARAASAGTFILYATHVAAMAPGTSIGAASPVSVGGGDAGKKGSTLERKVTNDAVAYIRGFAELRGRNADWAEQAVRDGVSATALDARRIGAVDLIASDAGELLARLEGRRIRLNDREVMLHPAGMEPREVRPDARTRLLGVIANPSVAYLLLMAAVYALAFELLSPGAIAPGVTGAVLLVIALYALNLLPINYAGLGLLLLGVGLMVAEAFLPSFGALGIGGLGALVVGSIMLLDDNPLPALRIPTPLIAGVALGGMGFLVVLGGMVARGHRRAILTGRDQLIGSRGTALEDLRGTGWARVRGERWKVRTAVAIPRGASIRVTRVRGLVLDVTPDNEQGAMR